MHLLFIRTCADVLRPHVHRDLHRFPEDQPLVLVEPPQLAQESVEQLAELAFEGLDAPQLCLGNHAQLALYASYAVRQTAPQVGFWLRMIEKHVEC